MKAVGIREFRDKATQYLRSKDPVLVTNHEKPAGVYVPLGQLKKMPIQIKRAVYNAIVQNIEQRLKAAGIREEEVLKDIEDISSRRS